MGTQYDASCEKCGHTFPVMSGGGFSFYLLRCDKCGREKEVSFEELRDLHRKHLESLSGPQSMATAVRDEDIREATSGPPPLIEAEIETLLRKHRCGGRFRFEAPPRCPKCRSVEIKRSEYGTVVDYD